MSLSGMTLDDSCVGDYKELQANHKYKFITFVISKNSICTLDKSSESNYAAFTENLPRNECRYAVYDLDFEKPDGGRRSKIVFILWSPDDARIKDKMIYASSKDALRTALPGISFEIQATDEDEITHECLLDKALKSF